METVKEIIENVRDQGETALKEYTEKFDGGVPANWAVSGKNVKRHGIKFL